VLGEVEHIFGDLHILDLVEILLLAADFIRITQRADQALVHRFGRDDVLAVGKHDPPDHDLVHLADHREGVVADLAASSARGMKSVIPTMAFNQMVDSCASRSICALIGREDVPQAGSMEIWVPRCNGEASCSADFASQGVTIP
jgi:hypothetical protein